MPQPDYKLGSGIFVKLRRLAIRAAKFEPEADCATWTVSEIRCDGISEVEKNVAISRVNLLLPIR
jgi:hypothetical protein